MIPDVLLHVYPMPNAPKGVVEQYVTLRNPETQEEVPFERLIYHSPAGLAYGYAGSGPSDLALNILALHFPLEQNAPKTIEELRASLGISDNDWANGELTPEAAEELWEKKQQLPIAVINGFVHQRVWELYQDFKREVIAPLDKNASHVISAQMVREWIERQ